MPPWHLFENDCHAWVREGTLVSLPRAPILPHHCAHNGSPWAILAAPGRQLTGRCLFCPPQAKRFLGSFLWAECHLKWRPSSRSPSPASRESLRAKARAKASRFFAAKCRNRCRLNLGHVTGGR
eukprot:scaffold4889_cov108-Isochrysis_galbana.AAC.3